MRKKWAMPVLILSFAWRDRSADLHVFLKQHIRSGRLGGNGFADSRAHYRDRIGLV